MLCVFAVESGVFLCEGVPDVFVSDVDFDKVLSSKIVADGIRTGFEDGRFVTGIFIGRLGTCLASGIYVETEEMDAMKKLKVSTPENKELCFYERL